jgi:septal ring factor EnvC (AmiA/AmiB activator)
MRPSPKSGAALVARKDKLAALEATAAAAADQIGSTALSAGDRVIAAEERAVALGSQQARAVSGRRLAADLAGLGAQPRPFTADSQASRSALAYRLPLDARVTEGSGSVSDAGIAARGITLAAARGAPLAMPAPGTIAFAGPYGRHDGVVIIDHGRGWMTLMTGVRAAASMGSRLEAGAPLGKALGPVTVELSINGRPVSAAMVAVRSPVTGR